RTSGITSLALDRGALRLREVSAPQCLLSSQIVRSQSLPSPDSWVSSPARHLCSDFERIQDVGAPGYQTDSAARNFRGQMGICALSRSTDSVAPMVTRVTELPPQNSVDSSPVASSRSPVRAGPDERGVRREAARFNRNGIRGRPRGPGRGGAYHALSGSQAGPRAALFELRLAVVPRGREGGVGD